MICREHGKENPLGTDFFLSPRGENKKQGSAMQGVHDSGTGRPDQERRTILRMFFFPVFKRTGPFWNAEASRFKFRSEMRSSLR